MELRALVRWNSSDEGGPGGYLQCLDVGQGLHGSEERGENWPAGQAEQLVAALLTAPVATRYTPVQLLSHGGRWPEHPDAELAVELISKHWKSSNELELSSVPYMRGLC